MSSKSDDSTSLRNELLQRLSRLRSRDKRSPKEMRNMFRRVAELMRDRPLPTSDHELTHEDMQERMRQHSERIRTRRAERKLRSE